MDLNMQTTCSQNNAIQDQSNQLNSPHLHSHQHQILNRAMHQQQQQQPMLHIQQMSNDQTSQNPLNIQGSGATSNIYTPQSNMWTQGGSNLQEQSNKKINLVGLGYEEGYNVSGKHCNQRSNHSSQSSSTSHIEDEDYMLINSGLSKLLTDDLPLHTQELQQQMQEYENHQSENYHNTEGKVERSATGTTNQLAGTKSSVGGINHSQIGGGPSFQEQQQIMQQYNIQCFQQSHHNLPRRSTGNSKSLVDGENPASTRGAKHPPDYNRENKKHQKSGDLPGCWDSSDEEIIRPQFQNNFIYNNNNVSDMTTNQPGASVFGHFSSSNHFSYNQNFSQTAVDDKQESSHHSWNDGEESCCSSPPDQNNNHNQDRFNKQRHIFLSPPQSSHPLFLEAVANGACGANYNQRIVINQKQNSNNTASGGWGKAADRVSNPMSQSIFSQTNNELDFDPYSILQAQVDTNQEFNRGGNHEQQTTTMMMVPSQAPPNRANSFDKYAKQQQNDFHQHFFGVGPTISDGKLQSQGDLDNYSAKSMGHLSSFSDGAIYQSSYQDQPGSLGALRAKQLYDASGNILNNQVNQSQNAYGFDPRQQYSQQNGSTHQQTAAGQQQTQQFGYQQNNHHPSQYAQHNMYQQPQFQHQQMQMSGTNSSNAGGFNLKVPGAGSNITLHHNQYTSFNQNQQSEDMIHYPSTHSSQFGEAGNSGYKLMPKQNINENNMFMLASQTIWSNQDHSHEFQGDTQQQFNYPNNSYSDNGYHYGNNNSSGSGNMSNPNGSYIQLTKKMSPGSYKNDQSQYSMNSFVLHHQNPQQNNMMGHGNNRQYMINGSVSAAQRFQSGNLMNEMSSGVPLKIGINAPSKIQRSGIDFNNHTGPMVAIQHNQIHGGGLHQSLQQPVFNPYSQFTFNPKYNNNRSGGATTTTTTSSNQGGDLAYGVGAANSAYPQYIQNTKSASAGTTTPHYNNNGSSNNNYNSDIRSNSSSNHSNNGGMIQLGAEQNEKLLRQIINQFDECPNQQQKFEIIKGNVHKLALEQTGSRFLQKQLNKASNQVVAFFLDEISEYFSDLMVDNYGNYFCQKLLQTCSSLQRLTILRVIQEKFIKISCNKRGTHTIQSMFDLINLPEEEELIIKALIGSIFVLAKDPQGTHVVQKVINTFEEDKRQFIFEEVFDHFIDLAKDTNGLCVIKKLIQIYCPQDLSSKDSTPDKISKNKQLLVNSHKLLMKIQENVIDLVQDPFGNYAVSEIIKTWDTDVCKPIFDTIKVKICTLSNQKFASNVIELCLERTSGEMRSELISEIRNSDKLASMIRNQFGNYVIQRALKVADGNDKDQLIKVINSRLPEITDRKIRSKWEQIVKDADIGIFQPSRQVLQQDDSTTLKTSSPNDFGRGNTSRIQSSTFQHGSTQHQSNKQANQNDSQYQGPTLSSGQEASNKIGASTNNANHNNNQQHGPNPNQQHRHIIVNNKRNNGGSNGSNQGGTFVVKNSKSSK